MLSTFFSLLLQMLNRCRVICYSIHDTTSFKFCLHIYFDKFYPCDWCHQLFYDFSKCRLLGIASAAKETVVCYDQCFDKKCSKNNFFSQYFITCQQLFETSLIAGKLIKNVNSLFHFIVVQDCRWFNIVVTVSVF